MAMNIVEASKLSQDVLLEGIVEMIVYDSPMLQELPFIEIVGNGLTYNQELTLGEIDFYSVGDDWNESTPTFEKLRADLTIMGGDADVDKFLKETRSNIQDLEAATIQLKSKALKDKFENNFIYGDATTRPKEFDGIRLLIDTTTASDQVVCPGGATGGTLTLSHLDQLVDCIKGGKPHALLMSKRSRRKIVALLRASGTNLEHHENKAGYMVEYWGDIPIWVTDWQLDTHTVAGSVETGTTGETNSVIYAFQMGEGALAGLTSPGHIQVEPIGTLEGKDAERTRIKWYCSLALFASIKAAALIGVQD